MKGLRCCLAYDAKVSTTTTSTTTKTMELDDDDEYDDDDDIVATAMADTRHKNDFIPSNGMSVATSRAT